MQLGTFGCVTIPVSVAKILTYKCSRTVREITAIYLLWCVVELVSITRLISEVT